jgi:hypothetical protein
MRPYLKNTHNKKGLVEWLKVQTLSSRHRNTHTHTHTQELSKKLSDTFLSYDNPLPTLG